MDVKKKSQRIINLIEPDDYIFTAIDAFILDRNSQGLSPRTIKYYREKLSLFARFADGQEVKQISQLDKNFIRLFMLWLEEKGHNPGGRHAHYQAVKAFLNWWDAEAEPENWRNPIHGLRGPRVNIPPLKPIPNDVFQALLKVCDGNTLWDYRDKAILMALLDTGARVGEFCALDIQDVDFITGSVMVSESKNRNPRIVFFSRTTRRAVRAYLKRRDDDSPALWINHTFERFKYHNLRALLDERSKQAKVKRYSPHSFRRAWTLNMLRAGTDVFTLKKMGGWRSFQVMRRYLDQDDTDTRRAHEKGSPVAGLV